jgi:hypothetical protein
MKVPFCHLGVVMASGFYISHITVMAGELVAPSATQIVAFANNPNYQYNSGDIYQPLSREQFLEFLQKGKVLPAGLSPNDLQLRGPVTFHEPLTPSQRAEIKAANSDESLLRCQGVAATKTLIYFWELRNDKVLWTATEHGDSCLLRKE